MSKQQVIGVIIVCVLVIGGFIFWTSYRKSPEPTVHLAPPTVTSSVDSGASMPLPPPPPPQTTTPLAKTRVKEGNTYVTVVSVSDSGFSPNNFSINSGETVRFVNKDQQSMRMIANTAGGLRPYVGFDQIKSVGKGASYQFIFSEVGVWGFINQFNPTFPLLIIVK